MNNDFLLEEFQQVETKKKPERPAKPTKKPKKSIVDKRVPFTAPKASAFTGVAMGVMKAQVEAIETPIAIGTGAICAFLLNTRTNGNIIVEMVVLFSTSVANKQRPTKIITNIKPLPFCGKI